LKILFQASTVFSQFQANKIIYPSVVEQVDWKSIRQVATPAWCFSQPTMAGVGADPRTFVLNFKTLDKGAACRPTL